jgi:ADP-dependent NAD(P)H-hydrate dehydratase / NAD(P)H-hydrate epimerase
VLPVVTAAEMRALDRATIEEVGIAGFTLMETAGRGVAEIAIAMAGRGHVAVICGPGNNGGDGYVVARVLRDRGIDAIVYLAAARAAIKGDALAHLEVLERCGGVIHSIATPQKLDEHRDAIARSALAVDALLGTGTTRMVEGHFATVIQAINAAPRRLAIDIPSGLDTDTGQTLGVAVDAHATVTMAALKIALVSSPGFARCGDVTIAEIGIPPALIAASTPHVGLVERADIERGLPRARPLDHKGRRGHVLVVGGKPEMRGAGRLAAMAALRAGAGLVTLTVDEPPAPQLAAGDPADSVMTRVVREPADLAGVIDDLAKRRNEAPARNEHVAVVIGPGLGTGDAARASIAAVLDAGVPVVFDADALNLLAGAPAMIAQASGPVVITPHPAEAARLLGTTTTAIEADRLAAARALAAGTRAVVVLKGARTIVCDGTLGDEHCAINPTGGPALATAGSGDVLAGAIAALLAQGLAPADAARAAVYIHGLAGEQLAKVYGERGVISSDLPVAIATAITEL